MLLNEVIEALITRYGGTQESLGRELGVSQGMISEMANPGKTWRKHWGLFLKVLDLCQRSGIDPTKPARKLGGGHEVAMVLPYDIRDRSKHPGVSESTDPRTAPKPPAADARPIPPRRVKKRRQ